MPGNGDYTEWDGTEWASLADHPVTEMGPVRWTKDQWVGDRGGLRGSRRVAARNMLEGERGLSGFRHNPGRQQWVPREHRAADVTELAGRAGSVESTALVPPLMEH